ncbi:hypothetical protein MAM1_0007c00804, partial [Mucor ambiguus]
VIPYLTAPEKSREQKRKHKNSSSAADQKQYENMVTFKMTFQPSKFNGQRMACDVNTVCHECDRGYFNPSRLNKHLRDVHNVEPAENIRPTKRNRQVTTANWDGYASPLTCSTRISPFSPTVPASVTGPVSLTGIITSEEHPLASSGNADKAGIIVRVDANTFGDNEEGYVYLGDNCCESASDTEDDGDADEDNGQEAEIRNSIDNIMAEIQSEIDVGVEYIHYSICIRLVHLVA